MAHRAMQIQPGAVVRIDNLLQLSPPSLESGFWESPTAVRCAKHCSCLSHRSVHLCYQNRQHAAADTLKKQGEGLPLQHSQRQHVPSPQRVLTNEVAVCLCHSACSLPSTITSIRLGYTKDMVHMQAFSMLQPLCIAYGGLSRGAVEWVLS